MLRSAEMAERMMAAADVAALEIAAFRQVVLTDAQREMLRIAFAKGAIYGATDAQRDQQP